MNSIEKSDYNGKMLPVKNLVELLKMHVEVQPDRPLLFVKKGQTYAPMSCFQLVSKVAAFREALKKMGVSKGDRVALLSNNCPQWVISDLAVLSLGAVLVPIYPTLSDEEIDYLLTDAEVKVAIVESKNNMKTIVTLKKSKDYVEHLVVFNKYVPLMDDFCHSFDLLQEEYADASVEDVFLGEVTRDDLASLVYTSGTTGNPKGVMLTHGNFLANVEDIMEALPLSEHESVLSFLPLSHVFERTCGYYTILALGARIYYADSIATVSQDLQLAKPTVLVSVPRLYEKIQLKILSDLTGVKKLMFDWALSVGMKCRVANKTTLNRLDSFLLGLADKLVFSKVREKTGGRLRFFVSGGAPLGKELGNFFKAMGLLIIEGYGQTETSPVIACNRLEHLVMGSVGKPLSSLEVDIMKDGELRVKGPSVMKGYWHLPDKTSEVLDKDGWLYTGDIVKVDSEGYLWIVDRKKDIMVLSNGKNISPQVLEQALLADPAITQAIVIGEGRHFVSALIVPHVDQLLAFAQKNKLPSGSVGDLFSQKKVRAFYQHIIDVRMGPFANYEKVKKFILLKDELTQESGELTPTLKPKRKVIREKYHSEIESIYQ